MNDVHLTIIKTEMLRANLRLASLILTAQLPELALLDNVSTATLGEAIEKVESVNVWLMTWQATLETNAQASSRY